MWQNEAARFGADGLISFLIANKHDLLDQGKPFPVPRDKTNEFAASFGTMPMHISAATRSGCEEAFRYIVRFLIEKFVFLFLALLLSFFIFTVCPFVGLICFSSKPSKKGIRCDGSVAVNPSAGNPQNNKCMC